ncbi:MAG: hypothetical protein K0S41_716 [Anaerocolumna sp.]|jgi:hypothetical protein|nr:hypothetical protein [Anaerocolumna sp.]
MKKITLYTMLTICFILMVGCKRKDIVITDEDVKTNTILVKNDGTIQAATVEVFDKSYYNLTELNTFITENINKYNQTNGENAITLNSLEQKDGDAVLILNFSNIDHYKTFNKVEANLLTAEEAKSSDLTLPDVFVNASDSSYISKDVALKNGKYKVLVLNENTDVLVDGTIKYYSEGALISKSKMQTAAEGETVIIYKP